jgi:foldase protein PrsA
MKNLMKKLIYVSLLVALLLSAVSCGKKNDDVNNVENEGSTGQDVGSDETSEQGDDSTSIEDSTFGQLVVTIGEDKVYYSEAMIYFKFIQAQYESYFGAEIWTYDMGGQTFGDMAKQEIINMIAQTKIISAQADKYNVALTEEDENLIKQNAETLLTSLTEEDKALYGFTEEVAQTFYRDNMLYEKVYEASTINVDTNVSDEEAKQITVQHLLVLTTEKDAEGNSTPFSDEKKAEAKVKAEGLLTQAKEADDFKSFAEANTEDSGVEYTFGKGEMVEAFETTAFAMKPGELSGLVETEYGYHIIYCVSDFNEDATLEKKEEIIASRQDQEFQGLYEGWSTDYEIKVNDEVWNTITFVSATTEEEPVGEAIEGQTEGADGAAVEGQTEGSEGETQEETTDPAGN